MNGAGWPAEDRIERYTGELITYTRSLFPMRFYKGEKWWTLYTAAAVLRLADISDSVLAHMTPRRDLDASSALRSMYELGVTVTWILIDPEARKPLWEGETQIQQLKLHNDLASFGVPLLNSKELSDAQAAKDAHREPPPLHNRAEESDDYWHTRIEGLHAPGNLLSFRGLYNAIYRLGSAQTHGTIASLLPYVEQHSNRFVVRQAQPTSGTVPYALVSPLLAITLTVAASKVEWIDADKVRDLNNKACAPGSV